jgi:pilus assembly protein CpaC
VIADLNPLRLQLMATFPDASLKLTALRDHVIVEGQARDTAQSVRIIETIKAYLESIRISQATKITMTELPAGLRSPLLAAPRSGEPIPAPREIGKGEPGPVAPTPAPVTPEVTLPPRIESIVATPRVINLIHVPGPQQVLLKVRVAELNRTALRQIGADFFAIDHDTGALVGTQIGGGLVHASGVIGGAGGSRLLINRDTNRTLFDVSPVTTAFGIFEKGGMEFLLSALRRNSLLRILAEPNLVAMNGYQASFLAGGEFPVPVAQVSGGSAPAITVQFRSFGVGLGFVPYILDDDTIRLTVDPEVSSIDTTLGTILVPGGSPVPGLNTRKAHTTVELHTGQTLAIAGLLQLTLDGQTNRIPGLGDLPILGPFFSNTTGDRIEKELVVLVTPYLVEPMNPEQVPPTPGDEVKTPKDLEFYLLNRIEGRTHEDWRSTTEYDDALHVLRCFMKLEKDHIRGPHGYCE